MMVFTQKQVKDAWREYKRGKVVQYLVAGKWKTVQLDGHGLPQHIGATRAQYRNLCDIVDFPGYLEQWKKSKQT